MRTPTLIFLCALGAAPAVLAQSQLPASMYRSGQAEVLAAPAPAADPLAGPKFDVGAFSAAYARAGKPAIALLWNREFSDMLEQNTITVARKDARLEEGRDVVAAPGMWSGRGEARESVVVRSGEIRTEQARRSGPVENMDFQMRSAFISAMTSRGVHLVDRNTVMRTTGRKTPGGDVQHVETDALAKHAKLLMEVLNTPDPASPTGWATQVTVKRFSDGRLIASGYVDGTPAEPGARRFEANPSGGFREVAAPGARPGDLGRLAAEQAMARLGEGLAASR